MTVVTSSAATVVTLMVRLKSSRLYFSSRPSSFFNYNSGRTRRRRLRREAKRRQRERLAQKAAQERDLKQRTVGDILFPNPYKGIAYKPENSFHWPTSFSMFREALAMTWSEYKSTWKGFLTSRGFLVQDDPNKTGDNSKLSPQPQESGVNRQEQVVKNVKRNVGFLERESVDLQKKVREQTGVNSAEDLKRLAGDMMSLASECVKEFMAGYRKGRDDEVEKMLTEYFKELEEEANKPKTQRRKPKRRVLAGRK